MSSNDTQFVAQVTHIVSTWLQNVNDWIWKGRNPLYAVSTGSANAQVVTLPSTSLYSGYVAGDSFVFQAGYTNTGATTLSIVGNSTLTATALRFNGSALVGGEIVTGNIIHVTYDGTYFQVASTSSNSSSVINIKDFGAKGDGTTNDSTAFAAALTVAQVNNALIYFPTGDYVLTAMSACTGMCRLFSNGDAVIRGLNWTDSSQPAQDYTATVSVNDAHFEATGITFLGVTTTPGLTIKNQSQGTFIRSGWISHCTFRGPIGLVMDNVQSCQITDSDFIHNTYGVKMLSTTNNIFTSCQFFSPVIGVYIRTSTDDAATRLGGENAKFVGCSWYDGVVGIDAQDHNYLWLDDCLIDYFNTGLYLVGCKFAKLTGSYIGYNETNKSALSGYIAPTQYGCLYGTGRAASSKETGLTAMSTEFNAYGAATHSNITLDGSTTGFTGIAEASFTSCRFGNYSASNTQTNLLHIKTAYDVDHFDNYYYSPSNNNLTAPWLFETLTANRYFSERNDFANCFNSGLTTIQPASGYIGNQKWEAQTVTATCPGADPSSNNVTLTYVNAYATTPKIAATVTGIAGGGGFAVQTMNVVVTAANASSATLRVYNTTNSNLGVGNTLTIDCIVMGY